MNQNFLQTNGGKYLIIGICYVVIFGLIYGLQAMGTEWGTILIIPGAVIGWKMLTAIQPAMFIWMPIIGWIIYFVVKAAVAAMIGLFVMPYYLGKKIWEMVNQ